MSFSTENPFRSTESLKRDSVNFARAALDEQAAQEMEELLGPDRSAVDPAENWDGSESFELSEEEKQRIKDQSIPGEIMAREKRALSAFFGRDVHVPPLPKEMTQEKIWHWESMGFKPHYLPAENLARITYDASGGITAVVPKTLAGWKKKPFGWFFDIIRDGNLSPDAATLPGCWVLMDARQKPEYQDGFEQMYENDPLAPVLEKLRAAKVIKKHKLKGSRFDLSPQELGNPKVMAAFAKALGVPTTHVSLPRVIEFVILGNMHYPEWGETGTSERFGDRWSDGRGPSGRPIYLCGGDGPHGGLSYVHGADATDSGLDIGFRLIVRFPSK